MQGMDRSESASTRPIRASILHAADCWSLPGGCGPSQRAGSRTAFFRLRGTGDGSEFLAALRDCAIDNTMTPDQKRRREELAAMGKKAVDADPDLREEKKTLDKNWRESPVVFGEPFQLRTDWFLDEWSGGKRLKTWAGQQAIVDIVRDLRDLMPPPDSQPETWLQAASTAECTPLNFDSNLGGAGADVDVGFSFDPLKSSGLRVAMRPAVELLAFVGLQRFRPAPTPDAWEYGLWAEPYGRELAALVSCCAVPPLGSQRVRFQLLYRTDYLKSFLPGRVTHRTRT